MLPRMRHEGTNTMNPPRSRFRRVAKWVGLVACVGIVLAWVASVYCAITYQCAEVGGCALTVGCAAIWTGQDARLKGFEFYYPGGSPVVWLPEYHQDVRRTTVGVPMWILLIVAAIPTAFLWHRDRRHPPGHCQGCGYNLTGNVSGACPECGCVIKNLPNEDCA